MHKSDRACHLQLFASGAGEIEAKKAPFGKTRGPEPFLDFRPVVRFRRESANLMVPIHNL
jgi:hypothetical protein